LRTLDDEKSIALDRQVERIRTDFDRALVEVGRYFRYARAQADLPRIRTAARVGGRRSEALRLQELRGKHGMRLAVHVNNAQSFPLQQNLKALMEPEHRMLSPMTPAQSLGLAFKSDAMHDELTCNSCHQPHQYRLQQAGLESCMGCHDDEHTRNYLSSPHYGLVLRERAGELPPGSGVTCATCHMPKTEDEHETGKFFTQHNQNDNLRPNEKMIRTVCLDCHGAQFVLNALADPALIHSNFNGQPSVSIDSIEMSVKRERKE